MDRQEAIEIIKQLRESCIAQNIFEEYSGMDIAIDTLIASIPITDEMVERAAKEFYEYDNAFGQMDCTGKQQSGACFDWLEGDDYELEINRAKSALTAALEPQHWGAIMKRFSERLVVQMYLTQRNKNLLLIAQKFERTVPQIEQILTESHKSGLYKQCLNESIKRTAGISSEVL
jgi:hypothetical protein